MSKVLSVRVPDELAEWADGYAVSRGVTRQALLESALQDFRADCESGVPDIRARVREMRAREAPRPGECSCPILPPLKNGEPETRGFSTKCKVHGGKTREDFRLATQQRSELFRTLQSPPSTRGLKAKEGK